MTPTSDWYPMLGYLTFPTIFIGLSEPEAKALAAGSTSCSHQRSAAKKLQRAISAIPGSCFVHADVCAPKDAPTFAKTKGSVRSGNAAWQLLCESNRVKEAIAAGTRKLGIRPYRRMDSVREFRLFIKDGKLVGISQMNLERHFARLNGRRKEIAQKAAALATMIRELQGDVSTTVDVYLTSSGELMIVDFNTWGAPTDPLLLRSWDRDWSTPAGLKLIEKPTKLGGDVEVSF